MQRGNRRQKVFFLDEDYQAYLDYVREARERFRVRILAWCLMPHHVHPIAVPGREESLARCFAPAHTRHTRRINFRKRLRGYLWQGRSASSAMDGPHLYHALRYVEWNPVRDGDLDETIPDWRAFLSEPDEQGFAEVIRRETAAGRPLGDDRFVRRLEKRLGRKLARGRPGWPKGRRRGRRGP